MASVGLIINIAVKTAAAPIKAFTGTWGSMMNSMRMSMRTFRDITIIFYGMRRGFDLATRAIKGAFGAVGGQGVDQLNQIEAAWTNLSATLGKAIQRSNTWAVVFETITGALRGGADINATAVLIDKIAAGFVLVASAILQAVKAVADFFNVVGTGINGLARYFGVGTAQAQKFAAAAQVARKEADFQESVGNIQAYNVALKESQELMRKSQEASEKGSIFEIRDTSWLDDWNKKLEALMARLLGPKTGGALQNSVFSGAYWKNNLGTMEAELRNVTGTVEGLGKEWVTVFSNMGEQALKGEFSWRDFGKSAGETFRKQFSQAVFSPLEQAFQQLADVAAIPFRIVGVLLNRWIVQPIADFISAQFVAVSTLEAVKTAAEIKDTATRAAVLAEVVTMGVAMKAALGPAAVASAIATAGTSLAAGFEAIALMAAGAVPLAEGGIVNARPGGTLALLGEGGRSEAVIPLDKAGGAMPFMGGRPVKVVVYGNLESRAQNRRLARDLGRQIYDEGKSTGYGKSRRRRV